MKSSISFHHNEAALTQGWLQFLIYFVGMVMKILNEYKKEFASEKVADDGYTCICPRCYARYNLDLSKIGKLRDLELTYCTICARKVKEAEHNRQEAAYSHEKKSAEYVSKKERRRRKLEQPVI